MTFLTIVTRGLLRRPVRTGFTIMGISIGIAAVVALVGISRGFETSLQNSMKTTGTDVVVSTMGSAIIPKPFAALEAGRIAPLPHVAEISPMFADFASIEKADMMIVSARAWGSFTWKNLKVISGRMPIDAKEKATVLGQTAAEVLQKKVGDKLQLETGELAVVGIVDGGAVVENGSVILSLALFQELTGNEGRINLIDVRVTPGTTKEEITELCNRITSLIPGARAVVAGENIRNSQAYRIIRAMSWGTSLLAVLVGVLGVMNTMLMTVFERTQEICVLLALGWRRFRIVRMILWESALLGFLGGVGGVVIGIVGAKLLATAPAIRGLLEPDLNPQLLARAVMISVGVGVLSGLYPAWHSSRLMPSQALHG